MSPPPRSPSFWPRRTSKGSPSGGRTTGWCSGFSYEMFFDADTAEDDIVREFGTVKVVVDATSADLLKGSTLDYSDGLQGAGFHVTNPNASRTCGCGSSFS